MCLGEGIDVLGVLSRSGDSGHLTWCSYVLDYAVMRVANTAAIALVVTINALAVKGEVRIG